ncbi:MAG: DUF3127 domain-containing protein [Muribaculum sp.]|nr:DUF3127 domain-containing protein [Muribaculaceae bacterium]MCM1080629.1 DUF3127 domain-containing protein [Muribaculum sp.]
MEIEGKIIIALPEQSGVSKAGNNWKKREYVLETMETYPKKVHFVLFGDRADQYPLSVGEQIKLSYDINSREFNGRWYTSIDGWKVEKGAATVATPQQPAYGAMPGVPVPPPAAPDLTSDATDDLPF